MSKIIFTILTVVLLGGGVFLWRVGMPESIFEVFDIKSEDGGFVIKMNDDEFSPAELKIKVGTTVRFINKGEYWHWPASDLHPTHSIYSEFDSKEPIGPGEEWTFTFDEAGEWYFHDHLSPYITGEIIVSEN